VADRLAFVLPLPAEVFGAHAAEQGWRLAETDDADEDEVRQVWAVPGGTITFVDDTVIEVQYVELGTTQRGPVTDSLAAEFTYYTRDDCLAALDLAQPEATVCRALKLLAATAPGAHDENTADRVAAALRDDRENVRVAALMVVAYTKWVEFLPQVSELETTDPSTRVRGFAGNDRMLLDAVRRSNA